MPTNSLRLMPLERFASKNQFRPPPISLHRQRIQRADFGGFSMLHAVTVRFDPAQFSNLAAAAKARGISIAETVRQRVAGDNSPQENMLALLVAEIDDQAQQLSSQQATLEAILGALENLASATPSAPSKAAQIATQAPPQSTSAQPPAATQKTGTGEAWLTWILRQPFADEDGGSPSARGRRVWQQFEAETGNEAPVQFRGSAHRQ